jgi:phenylacetate-CoA ligase
MRRPGPATRLAAGVAVAVRAEAHRRMPTRSTAALVRRQERAVRAAVDHAARHVPYYRESMRRLGLDAAGLRTAADLARLPVIEREHLQTDPEYFFSEAVDSSDTVTVGSGGSTGQPVMVRRDRDSLLSAPLLAARPLAVMAAIAGTRWMRAAIIAPPISSGGTLHEALSAAATFSRGVRTPTRHLSLLDPPDAHTAVLEDFRPHVITSYGSYLERLLVSWDEGERPRHLPAVVAYGADALSESAREIAIRLGIQPISRYQSIEAGAIGFECERHAGHHVNMDMCPVRIVDAEGREVAAGESGDVVISNLTNRATVLLNYRQGDLAHTTEPCTCGRNLPMISLLEGRTAEWLTDRDGQAVHPQAVKMLLRTEAPIRRYQVVQERRDRFALSVVPAPETDLRGLAARLERRFAEQFGEGTATEVRFVEDLPRTDSGKVRTVISLVESC